MPAGPAGQPLGRSDQVKAKRRDRSAAWGKGARRLAGRAGCLGAAAAIAAHAASATFQGSGTATQSPGSAAGDVYLTIPSTGSTNRLALAVNGLFPAATDNSDVATAGADKVWKERVVNVTNAGNVDLATFSVGVQADNTSSANLVTGSTATGLVLMIDECSQNWTEDLTDTNNPIYSCGGTRNDVLGARGNVGGAPVDYAVTTSLQTWTTSGSPTLANISLTAGAVNHLRFRFKLAYAGVSAAQGTSRARQLHLRRYGPSGDAEVIAQLVLMGVAIAFAVAGIAISPRRRRTIAVACVLTLVVIVAVPPTLASWTIGAAGDGRTQPTVNSTPFNAASIERAEQPRVPRGATPTRVQRST